MAFTYTPKYNKSWSLFNVYVLIHYSALSNNVEMFLTSLNYLIINKTRDFYTE